LRCCVHKKDSKINSNFTLENQYISLTQFYSAFRYPGSYFRTLWINTTVRHTPDRLDSSGGLPPQGNKITFTFTIYLAKQCLLLYQKQPCGLIGTVSAQEALPSFLLRFPTKSLPFKRMTHCSSRKTIALNKTRHRASPLLYFYAKKKALGMFFSGPFWLKATGVVLVLASSTTVVTSWSTIAFFLLAVEPVPVDK